MIKNYEIYDCKGDWEGHTFVKDSRLHIKDSKTPYTGIIVAHHKNKSLQYRSTYKNGNHLKTESFYDNGQLDWSSKWE